MRELGNRQAQELTPQILARENALGRLNSGSVGDVLSSTYGDINANIESSAASLKAGDEQFYFDAAYQNQVRKLMEGRTSIVIAHRLSTIQKAHRIVVMKEGRIVEVGTHSELLEKENGVYRRLYEMQFNV